MWLKKIVVITLSFREDFFIPNDGLNKVPNKNFMSGAVVMCQWLREIADLRDPNLVQSLCQTAGL